MEPTFIRGWQRLTDTLTTSGMPNPEDLHLIAGLGVTRVIDLTSEGHVEAVKGEPVKLKELGVSYFHLPVPFDRNPDDYYQQFVSLLEASDEVTHVHCVANWRVSCFFYRYHLQQGMAEDQARAIMRMQWEPDASDHPVAAPWKRFVQEAKARAEMAALDQYKNQEQDNKQGE